jgi:hypothetical protein
MNYCTITNPNGQPINIDNNVITGSVTVTTAASNVLTILPNENYCIQVNIEVVGMCVSGSDAGLLLAQYQKYTISNYNNATYTLSSVYGSVSSPSSGELTGGLSVSLVSSTTMNIAIDQDTNSGNTCNYRWKVTIL